MFIWYRSEVFAYSIIIFVITTSWLKWICDALSPLCVGIGDEGKNKSSIICVGTPWLSLNDFILVVISYIVEIGSPSTSIRAASLGSDIHLWSLAYGVAGVTVLNNNILFPGSIWKFRSSMDGVVSSYRDAILDQCTKWDTS